MTTEARKRCCDAAPVVNYQVPESGNPFIHLPGRSELGDRRLTVAAWCWRVSPFLSRYSAYALIGSAILGAASSASAAILMVGQDRAFHAPSEAARVVQSGDTVRIAPGTYFDCAVWTTNDVTVEGSGPGVVLADKSCQGKGIFVIYANDVRVKNLTFKGARVPNGNGAGIRAEGGSLTIESSKFIDNEDGILGGIKPGSSIIIRDSEFDHNGTCIQMNGCAHGVYVGHIALLRIERSTFFNTQVAHHIKSRARRTELIDNHIEDGPNGTASFEVDVPNGGALIMVGNWLEKGPKNQNHSAAVIIGEEGVSQLTSELIFKDNVLINDGPPTVFLKNLTATPAELTGNEFKGPVKALTGRGTIR